MRLNPFHPVETSVELSAHLQWGEEDFQLQFELKDPKGEVIYPLISKDPKRSDELWKQTCFEAFFHTTKDNYWELNQSPSGDWNVYSFESYREGMKVSRCHAPVFHIQNIEIIWSAKDMPFKKESIDFIGPTAVINIKDRGLTFWAIEHKGEHPDFHLR